MCSIIERPERVLLMKYDDRMRQRIFGLLHIFSDMSIQFMADGDLWSESLRFNKERKIDRKRREDKPESVTGDLIPDRGKI